MGEKPSSPEKSGHHFSFQPGTLDVLQRGRDYVQVSGGAFGGTEPNAKEFAICKDLIDPTKVVRYYADKWDIVAGTQGRVQDVLPPEQLANVLHADEDVMVTGTLVSRKKKWF